MLSSLKCGLVSLLPVLTPLPCGRWSQLLRKGVPSRQPCPPPPPLCIAGPGWPPGPRLENRHSPLCQARSGKGRAAAAPARSPSQGTGSRVDGMTGAAEGPGPGTGTWGWGRLGVAWRSREEQEGSLSPALPGCKIQESCSCSWRWHTVGNSLDPRLSS